MYTYTATQWLLFFYIYCFIGWCFESTYVSFKQKHLINRGFMHGPYLPIYGSGALVMLIVSSPFSGNLFLAWCSGLVSATILEYITGAAMEHLFKVRYWDYSSKRFNFQGRICLGSSLAWGFMTLILTKVIHAPIARLVLMIPTDIMTILIYGITAMFASDFALSVRAALDMKNVLLKLDRVKDDLVLLQHHIDELITVADDEILSRREILTKKIEDYILTPEERMIQKRLDEDKLRQQIKLGLEKLSERYTSYPQLQALLQTQFSELRQKYEDHVQTRKHLLSDNQTARRKIFRSNPSMISPKFRFFLNELKKYVDDHR